MFPADFHVALNFPFYLHFQVGIFGPPDTLYQGGYFKVSKNLKFQSSHNTQLYTDRKLKLNFKKNNAYFAFRSSFLVTVTFIFLFSLTLHSINERKNLTTYISLTHDDEKFCCFIIPLFNLL